MTTVLGPPAEPQALYPPKVEPPPRPLPLRRFLLTFVRNPLSSLPRPVYEEPIVVHDNGHNVIAWVTDPALVEQVLLHGGAQFPKTALEKRVFAHTLGEGILTSEGASWRWRRRCSAPPIFPGWCRS
jgi:cytochrome P450